MDLFTHFLVPFIILNLLKVKNKFSGAFGGISIDFDFFLIGIGFIAPELFIFSHRGITHSFIFGFVTVVIFIYILTRPAVKSFINKLTKRPFNVEFNAESVSFAYFGVIVHLFLDYLTTGGIPLFYPISLTRFSANIYYYTDVFTTLLAIAVIIILYLRLQHKYKKMAMFSFLMIISLWVELEPTKKLTPSRVRTSVMVTIPSPPTPPTIYLLGKWLKAMVALNIAIIHITI
ncbi:MAG TPA: metal-dependent hydrolase, partial [Methanobacteriaceae archaeon]|nr:metal-dependent hydrolase [Methanobacteriaceae archaeon]